MSAKRQYKKNLKRFAIYWVVLIPLVVLFVFALTYTNLSSPVRIILIAVFGLVFVLLCELVRYFINLKRDKKPQKSDPFAD